MMASDEEAFLPPPQGTKDVDSPRENQYPNRAHSKVRIIIALSIIKTGTEKFK